MITLFREEKLDRHTKAELIVLADDHIAEVGPFQFTFDVDWDKLIYLQEVNKLVMFTVRCDDNLVGYAIYLIDTHTHFCTTTFAGQDALFIAKEHRGNGNKFLEFIEDSLLRDGVDAVTQGVLPTHDYSGMLLERGYVASEHIYIKQLRGIA